MWIHLPAPLDSGYSGMPSLVALQDLLLVNNRIIYFGFFGLAVVVIMHVCVIMCVHACMHAVHFCQQHCHDYRGNTGRAADTAENTVCIRLRLLYVCKLLFHFKKY